MRLILISFLSLIVLVTTTVSAEAVKKDGVLVEEIDMRNNTFLPLDQSEAVIRTLIDLDWHISAVNNDSIEADFDGKARLKVGLTQQTISVSEVSNNFIFEPEWFPKIRAGIIRELLFIGHMRAAKSLHKK